MMKLVWRIDFLMKYVEDNGYQVSGQTRECYIDGIWNKDQLMSGLQKFKYPLFRRKERWLLF